MDRSRGGTVEDRAAEPHHLPHQPAVPEFVLSNERRDDNGAVGDGGDEAARGDIGETERGVAEEGVEEDGVEFRGLGGEDGRQRSGSAPAAGVGREGEGEGLDYANRHGWRGGPRIYPFSGRALFTAILTNGSTLSSGDEGWVPATSECKKNSTFRPSNVVVEVRQQHELGVATVAMAGEGASTGAVAGRTKRKQDERWIGCISYFSWLWWTLADLWIGPRTGPQVFGFFCRHYFNVRKRLHSP